MATFVIFNIHKQKASHKVYADTFIIYLHAKFHILDPMVHHFSLSTESFTEISHSYHDVIFTL